MSDQAEANTWAVHICELAGTHYRRADSVFVQVLWEDLDKLADALRSVGLKVDARNLGTGATG